MEGFMPDSNMTRRDFLTSAFSTALAATLASSSIDTQKAEAAPVKKKPNLVVILRQISINLQMKEPFFATGTPHRPCARLREHRF
jgi:hypothetical protein